MLERDIAEIFRDRISGQDGVVLDIDETLSGTVLYLMERMQKLFGNPEGLSAGEMVKQYQYTQHVPYWQNEEARSWQLEAVTSSELYLEVPLVAGADIFVNRMHAVVPVVAYMTTRPESTDEATGTWLSRHGFPDSPVISRPEEVHFHDGIAWKARLIEMFYPYVRGIVDDNQGLVGKLDYSYQGTVFLFGHSSAPESRVKAVPCIDWQDTYEKVLRHVCQ